MLTRTFDLHTHTRCSDGTETPAANVRTAQEAGLGGLAITDHDTVAGISEALAEGERLGLTVVPGVEISTVADGIDIHVLGYWLRWEDPVLLSRLSELRSVRDRRNEMILERLNELGLTVTMEEVMSAAARSDRADETVGRPHIADVLLQKGYVTSFKEAFDRYLGKDGAAYLNPPRIRPEEAVRWIHEAGGAAVLAHPGLYGNDALIAQLLDTAGFDGVEADHSDHSEEDAARYGAMGRERGLILTAGSDYHGVRGGVVFHAPLGSKRVPASVLDELMRAAQLHRSLSQ